jgi:hypothetical protein
MKKTHSALPPSEGSSLAGRASAKLCIHDISNDHSVPQPASSQFQGMKDQGEVAGK